MTRSSRLARSDCHQAKMRVEGGLADTSYYVCSQCGKPCGIYVPEGKLAAQIFVTNDLPTLLEHDDLADKARRGGEQLQIKALGQQGTCDALYQFASTLTTRAKELQAQEASYNIAPGQSTEILRSMIESFVHVAVRVGVNQEYHRHDVIERSEALTKQEVLEAIGEDEHFSEQDPMYGIMDEPSVWAARNELRALIRSELGLTKVEEEKQ